MISTLHIENFRNLKSLSLNSLGRLNLITGKNNTGKSSILEAILIYVTKCDLSYLKQFLISRGESLGSTEANNKALASIFPNRQIDFEFQNAIRIQALGLAYEQNIELKFVNYFFENNGYKIIDDSNKYTNSNLDIKQGFQIKVGDKSRIVNINGGILDFVSSKIVDNNHVQIIGTRNIERNLNATLWDNIILTDKENYVIDALKIIEPTLQKIAFVEDLNNERKPAFVEESKNERKAVIRLSDSSKILPIGSMGDGINRILTIILALVNADNGYLLIDEFENGLHYSVQEKLWEIIYDLAIKLNVQVFVTTHSEDCIRGFQALSNDNKTDFVGNLIRLDKVGDKISQVEFTLDELKIAEKQNIEIR